MITLDATFTILIICGTMVTPIKHFHFNQNGIGIEQYRKAEEWKKQFIFTKLDKERSKIKIPKSCRVDYEFNTTHDACDDPKNCGSFPFYDKDGKKIR